MRTRARAASIAMAGAALLVAPVLAAGPASAAPTVMSAPTTLTQATCQAGGGTFTLVKGLKTCTTLSPFQYSDDVRYTSFEGSILAFYTVHSEASYTLQFVQTQRGKGSIAQLVQPLPGGTFDTYVVPGSESCVENVDGDEVPIDVSVCEDLGLYTRF